MTLGTIIRSFASPAGIPAGLAWDGCALWLAMQGNTIVYQIDPVTGTVVRSLAMPTANVSGIEVGGSRLWVSSLTTNLIYEIDIVSGTVIRSFAGPSGVRGIAWDGRFLWASSQNNNTISQIDPVTGTVVRLFASPSTSAAGLAWDGHHLWHCDYGTDRIYQIDPITGTVIRSAAGPSTNSIGITWDGRALWHCDFQSDTIYQLSVSAGDAYYIDATGGNDANDGRSPTQAWQTIGKVNGETFNPGDRILFNRGETWTGTMLTIPSSGILGNPITLADYGTGALPIIDADDAVNYAVYMLNGQYITMRNLDLRNGLSSCAGFTTCSGIMVISCDMSGAGNDNLLFYAGCSNCSVYGGTYFDAAAGGNHCGIEIADGGSGFIIDGAECYNNNEGISINGHVAAVCPSNVTVRNCIIRDNLNNGIQVGVDLASGTLNVTIEDCTVYDNANDNIQITPIGADYPSGVTIQRCVSHGSTRYTYYIAGDNITMAECVSHDGGSATCKGIRILNGTNVAIYNCTGYTDLAGWAPVVFDGARLDNVKLENLIQGNGVNGTIIEVTAAAIGATLNFDYNLYQANAAIGKWKWNGAWINFATWKVSSGQDANSPTPADPLFVNPGADDFHLQLGSPAIDTGIDVGYGNDIGAYQYIL